MLTVRYGLIFLLGLHRIFGQYSDVQDSEGHNLPCDFVCSLLRYFEHLEKSNFLLHIKPHRVPSQCIVLPVWTHRVCTRCVQGPARTGDVTH